VVWLIAVGVREKRWNVCIEKFVLTGVSVSYSSYISIPGGSEEIMIDLSMRQSLKVAQALGAKL
jgi:hypothetical protein